MSTLHGSEGLARAIELLRAGEAVAIPTETVYGLAADASRPSAVAKIFAIKGRPSDHPLIVHLADADQLDTWAHSSPIAERLAQAFWPGPLTMVLPRRPRVPDAVTGGRDTVGLRVPDHQLAQQLCAAIGGLAAPSANRFGKVSPTTAAHVLADLGDDADVLDGGPCAVGVESTIVELTSARPTILRPGGISADQLDAVLSDLISEPVQRHATGPSRAPGMLPSHYAPSCRVVLIDDAEVAAAEATRLHARLLAPNVDAISWARQLYDWLREADRDNETVLIVVPPAAGGLGDAVRDRLQRAAFGR
jgi:L-threonylcarbamoyladenylate synthase